MQRNGGRRYRARLIGRLAAISAACACVALSGCGGGGSPAAALSARSPGHPAPSAPAAVRPRPNIVFVLTDDLGFNLLRFMPHVQAMEREGASFASYVVADSLCCPSRASIFTGELPHNHGVLDNYGVFGGFGAFWRRGGEQSTFAVALHRAGYMTAMMGKYLNGYLQSDLARYHDGAAATVTPQYVPPGWTEWDVAGWGYNEFGYRLNESGTLRWYDHSPQDYFTDVLARKGARFVDLAVSRHRPFFLELSTFAPHAPYTPAPRNARDFPNLRMPHAATFNRLPTDPPSWLRGREQLNVRDMDEIDRTFRQRARSVEAVDRLIADIRTALRANGALSNTYIVFSSDNGMHMGDYRLMPGKATAFDTDIRVPLIVTGPGVTGRTVVPQLAENIDLAETFAAIGQTQLRGDGHSLLALWNGKPTAPWRNAALIEYHREVSSAASNPDFQPPQSGDPGSYHAIRASGFLYVEYGGGETEFYDLRRDPAELHNLANRLTPAQHAQLHRELRALKDCRGATGCWKAMHIPPLPGRW